MNTVKIGSEADIKLTAFAKKTDYSKTKILGIILRNLTDKQLKDVVILNMVSNMGEDKNKIDWGEDGPKTISPDDVEIDGQKYTSYGDIICPECGMGSDECDCVEEIDWDDDEEEEEDEEED